MADDTLVAPQAIRVANEEWDVDFISMSFGFAGGAIAIHQEIDKALIRGKTVFAAASNDGANTGRAYPAKHANVICVHSTDGQGNPSSFNPTALVGDNNFCFVGEHVSAAWPSSSLDKPLETKYQSGTSFATPVAVAVAALMVGVVSKAHPEHIGWRVGLKSPAGIAAIFRSMSERRSGDYDVVNPVSALGINGAKLPQLVLDIQARLHD